MRARLIEQRHVAAIRAAFWLPLLGAIPAIGSDYLWWQTTNLTRSYYTAVELSHVAAAAMIVGFLVAALVPFHVLRRHQTAIAKVTLRDDGIRVGRTAVEAKNVTGFSVAADGHGVSVAIGTGDTTTFLEVDSIEDARSIASALGVGFPLHGDLRVMVPRQSLSSALGIFAFVDVCMIGLVLLLGARHEQGEAIAGGLLIAFLLRFVVRARVRDAATIAWGKTAYRAEPRLREGTAMERHIELHRDGMLREEPEAPRVRVDLLARGDDEIPAWLARIDNLERAGGYRGERTPRELLYETVNDANAAIDLRLGAARLLRLRDHEESFRILEGITDSDVRARISAVTIDDADDAAEQLEAIGPMFRTR